MPLGLSGIDLAINPFPVDHIRLLTLSNRLPTEKESNLIRAVLGCDSEQIKTLDKEIVSMTEQIKEAEEEICSLNAYLSIAQSHRNIFRQQLALYTTLETDILASGLLISNLPSTKNKKHSSILFHLVASQEIQLSTIRSSIEEQVKQIDIVEAQIHSMALTTAELALRIQLNNNSLNIKEQYRHHLYSTASTYRELLNRGRGLPNEVLLKILTMAVNQEVNAIQEHSSTKHTYIALRLSGVCNGWRSAIYTLPGL